MLKEEVAAIRGLAQADFEKLVRQAIDELLQNATSESQAHGLKLLAHMSPKQWAANSALSYKLWQAVMTETKSAP